MTDLVERLRATYTVRDDFSICRPLVNPDGPEAADELERLRARVKVLEEELKTIAEMTDPDDEDNYRSDDREGCLDTANAIARAALSSEQSHD